jgi:hypothetical protein
VSATTDNACVTFTCPYCGTEEGSEMMLRNNHWVELDQEERQTRGFYWPKANGVCIAQDLVSNHLRYYIRQLRLAPQIPHAKRRAEHVQFNREQIAETVLWLRTHNVDPDPILAEFEPLSCRACVAGNHHLCHGDLMVDEATGEHTTCPCGHEERSNDE